MTILGEFWWLTTQTDPNNASNRENILSACDVAYGLGGGAAGTTEAVAFEVGGTPELPCDDGLGGSMSEGY